MDVLDRLCAHAIIPVVVVDSVEQGLGVAGALADGGLPIAEVTLRTEASLDALEAIASRGDVLTGAGTVTRAEQVDAAVQAGARFLVSPGTSSAVMERAARFGVPVIPGAVSATEIMRAADLGATTVKFFPARASGGVAAVRALAAPFTDIRFVPTGGIGADDLADYLAIPSVSAVGGSWMLPSAAVESGRWREVTELVRDAVERGETARPRALR